MALKLVDESRYRIERKGYEGLVFSGSSKDWLVWPEAVSFAAQKGGVLQSAAEAAAFRIEAEGKDGVNTYQATRTAAVYFREGGKFYVAFDDVVDSEKNIILARVQEGYAAHNGTGKWLLSKHDEHVKALLLRAEKVGRVCELSEKNALELSLEQRAGVSEFGKSLTPVLLDVAEPYAMFLKSKRSSVRFYGLTPDVCEFLVVGDKVEVRPGCLGGVDFGIVVDVVSNFSGGGRSRGVVHP